MIFITSLFGVILHFIRMLKTGNNWRIFIMKFENKNVFLHFNIQIKKL